MGLLTLDSAGPSRRWGDGRRLGAAALLLCLSMAVTVDRASGEELERTRLAEGPLEGLAWTDLEGRTWRSGDFEGKVVLLDFWATWCTPCLAEMPHLRELRARFADEDVVILGIALEATDRRRLRSFLRRHDITWPQIHESEGTSSRPARRFGVTAVPATRLIDRRGRLVAADLRGPALEATLEILTGF